MTQRHGRGMTALAWLGLSAVGCGGWVDLDPMADGGSAGRAGSMAVGGTESVPPNGGKTGASTEPTGDGGEPPLVNDGGAGGADSLQVPRFVALTAPEPQRWPSGVDPADLAWSGTTSIDAGSLEDGALAGSTSYCFKVALSGGTCEYSTREPFVWTEAEGMVALDGLDAVGDPTTTSFYPSFVTADGGTVVGSYDREGGTRMGFFRWTKQAGLVPLGVPPNTASGGAFYVSKDGEVVAGVVKRKGQETAQFTWTESDGFELLDAARGWPAAAEVVGISEDGQTLLAQVVGQEPRLLYRFTDATGAQSLGTLPSTTSCEIGRATPDLSTVFGHCYTYPNPGGAFRWTEADGMAPVLQEGTDAACLFATMAVTPAGTAAIGSARCGGDQVQHWASWSSETGLTLHDAADVYVEPTGSTRDGKVVFGIRAPSALTIDRHGFTYEGGASASSLPPLVAGESSWALGSNASGTTLVGRSGQPNDGGTAVLWNSNGAVDIAAELNAAAVPLHGVKLQAAARVAQHPGVTVVQGVSDAQQYSGVWFAWLDQT